MKGEEEFNGGFEVPERGAGDWWEGAGAEDVEVGEEGGAVRVWTEEEGAH